MELPPLPLDKYDWEEDEPVRRMEVKLGLFTLAACGVLGAGWLVWWVVGALG